MPAAAGTEPPHRDGRRNLIVRTSRKEPKKMKFNQYYLDCLSHASYLIGDESTGRAVVVDPPTRCVRIPQ